MKELTITKVIFDDWWLNTNAFRLTSLPGREVDALADYHWKELQATAIRHSLRESKEEIVKGYHDVEESPDSECTCNSAIAYIQGFHLKDCPVYNAKKEQDDPTEGCTCGSSVGGDWHFEDCPVEAP